MPLNVVQGCFFHLTKPLIFIRRGRRNFCVYKYDSGIKLWATFQHFQVPWLSYLWAALFVRGTRELNSMASLFISQDNSLWYQATPTLCSQETVCLPVPCAAVHSSWLMGPQPKATCALGLAKNNVCITMRNAQAKLTLLPPRQMEPWKKRAGAKLKTTCQPCYFPHIHDNMCAHPPAELVPPITRRFDRLD